MTDVICGPLDALQTAYITKGDTQMQTRPNTVAELATTLPQSIMVLERLGIDYCCNGKQTIDEACRNSGITTDELLNLIATAPQPSKADRTWDGEPMAEIVAFIVGTHHRYTREAMAMLSSVATKVFQVHGANHDELRLVEKLVHELSDDLLPHMLKEEQVLFPYINSVEEASMLGSEPPLPFFGTARNPIRMMMLEHETVGEKVLEIRRLTANFTLPPEACTSYRTLYSKLEEIEQDLHRHIHLENNILFPRAIEVEEKTRTTPIGAAFNDHCCVK
jgi:regulator of cell morphogenesis and NO signaling